MRLHSFSLATGTTYAEPDSMGSFLVTTQSCELVYLTSLYDDDKDS